MLGTLLGLLGLATKKVAAEKALELGKDVYHRLAKTEEERKHLADLDAKLETEEGQRDLQLALGQISVNKTEAQHSNTFIAGWRPFIGWGLGSVLVVSGMGVAVRIWVGMFVHDLPPMPDLAPLAPFFGVLTTMLGVNAMLRSRDKRLGTSK